MLILAQRGLFTLHSSLWQCKMELLGNRNLILELNYYMVAFFQESMQKALNSVGKKKQKNLSKQINKHTHTKSETRNSPSNGQTNKQTNRTPPPKDPWKISMLSFVSFYNRKNLNQQTNNQPTKNPIRKHSEK